MKKVKSKKIILILFSLLLFLSSFLLITQQGLAAKKSSVPKAQQLTKNNLDHIIKSEGRFVEHDLHDNNEAKRLAEKLGFKQGITAVPRSKAIQQGIYLDGTEVTTFPKPSPEKTGYYIEGEYGFIPRWTEGKSSASVYLKKDGEYEKKDTTNLPTFRFNHGEDGYVKFTNMGYYHGKSVTIVMRPSPASIGKGVTIGLKGSTSLEKTTESYMSVSQTGNYIGEIEDMPDLAQSAKNRFGSHYVDMNYQFYDSADDAKWNKDFSKNEASSLQVSGFFTFNDFDYEESIGLDRSLDLHRLYLIQANQKDGPMTMDKTKDVYNPKTFEGMPGYKKDDPLGVKTLENAGYNNLGTPYQKYLSQYSYALSDWFNQLEYSVVDGFTFISRGSQDDTLPYKISNWLSFTYGKTKQFTLKINASSLESVRIDSTVGFEELINEDSQEFMFPWKQSSYDEMFPDTKLFYKIMEKKGVNEIELRDEDGKDFDEVTDKDKAVVFYDDSPTDDVSEFWDGNYDDELREKNIKLYFKEQFKRYQRQKVEDSEEEKILEGMYEAFVDVKPGKKYSVYGLNKSNIGNFSVPGYKSYTAEEVNDNDPSSISYFLKSQTPTAESENEDFQIYHFLADYTAPAPAPDDEKKDEKPTFLPYNWSSLSHHQNTTFMGSTIGFTPDTFVPIIFPPPIKVVEKDDSTKGSNQNHEIDWRVIQDIPPRILNNSEQKYTMTDEVDKILKIKNVTVTNLDTGMAETQSWDIKIEENGKEVTLNPKEDWLKAPAFYNRSIAVELKTELDEEELSKLTTEELKEYKFEKNEQGEVKYVLVPNKVKVTLSWSVTSPDGAQFSDYYDLYSSPAYGDSTTNEGKDTIGKLILKGSYNLEKIDKETKEKLPNAEFEIRKEKNDTNPIGEQKKTDGKGRISWKELPLGEYWLVETKAPAGYRLRSPEKIYAGVNQKYNSIDNEKARKIGKMSDPIKKVLNDKGEDIEGRKVSIGEELTYQVSVKDEHSEPDRVLENLFIIDNLDKNLELVENTTSAKLEGEPARLLSDLEVWNTEKTKLDTSSVTGLTVDSKTGKRLTFEFKVIVRDNPSDKIINKASVTGSGLDEADLPKTETKESNIVTNFVHYTLNVRQAIRQLNGDLAFPEGKDKGYFKLKNLNAQQTVLSTVNVLSESTMNINSSQTKYTKVVLIPSKESTVYEVDLVIPEMYRYVGYSATEQAKQNLSDWELKKEIAKIDLKDVNEQYVTLVIEPNILGKPMFYNWDYQLNKFNQEIKVENKK